MPGRGTVERTQAEPTLGCGAQKGIAAYEMACRRGMEAGAGQGFP